VIKFWRFVENVSEIIVEQIYEALIVEVGKRITEKTRKKTETHGILCVAHADAKRLSTRLSTPEYFCPAGKERGRTNLPCFSVFFCAFSVILFNYTANR
jgi:hypothetical protein